LGLTRKAHIRIAPPFLPFLFLESKKRNGTRNQSLGNVSGMARVIRQKSTRADPRQNPSFTQTGSSLLTRSLTDYLVGPCLPASPMPREPSRRAPVACLSRHQSELRSAA
jgi:hypothetical protein